MTLFTLALTVAVLSVALAIGAILLDHWAPTYIASEQMAERAPEYALDSLIDVDSQMWDRVRDAVVTYLPEDPAVVGWLPAPWTDGEALATITN